MRRAPLSRPMFRSRTAPGASRQPTGVLASSPELMQAAMRNLPNPAPGAGVQNPFQPAVFNQGAGESLLQNMSAPALNIAAGDRPLDVSAAHSRLRCPMTLMPAPQKLRSQCWIQLIS